MAGCFITFEGGEGAGKSTQIRRLALRLEAIGRPLCITREPGGTPSGEMLRTVMLTPAVHAWSAEAEALMAYAARHAHLLQIIRPALERGEAVLCDRFSDSTRAYQGYAGGCSFALLDCLETEIVESTKPDLTIILDLDPEIGLARAKKRSGAAADRFESRNLDFHRALRCGFLEIAQNDGRRCRVIPAHNSEEEIALHVWQMVQESGLG